MEKAKLDSMPGACSASQTAAGIIASAIADIRTSRPCPDRQTCHTTTGTTNQPACRVNSAQASPMQVSHGVRRTDLLEVQSVTPAKAMASAKTNRPSDQAVVVTTAVMLQRQATASP